jgi:hypothetical protein
MPGSPTGDDYTARNTYQTCLATLNIQDLTAAEATVVANDAARARAEATSGAIAAATSIAIGAGSERANVESAKGGATGAAAQIAELVVLPILGAVLLRKWRS